MTVRGGTVPTGSVVRNRGTRRAVVLHVAFAVVLGVLADIGLHLGERTTFLFTAATPWVVLAFSAGRVSSPRWSVLSPRWSVLAGGGTLLAGLTAYYLWLLLGMHVSIGVLTGSGYKGVTWFIVGAVVGAVAGGIGGMTRCRRRLLADAAWCSVIAVPCAEGVTALGYGAAPPIAMLAVLGGAALALLAWAWRSGARAWALGVGVPLATLALWNLELVILQHAFGRLTWI